MDLARQYSEASVKTASDLRTIARSAVLSELSRLTLPEIDAAVDLVARWVPAGNVPGLVLNGLARLRGRRPPPQEVRRDIGLLFQGIEQVLDRAVYAAFFAGPAAVIWGYQQLLKLAGIAPGDAFPDGTWQFYVEYALREDTARHANETDGFDAVLMAHGIHVDAIDRTTAWVMAAIHCLHQYDALLENEWRERVYTHLLEGMTAAGPAGVGRIYRDWSRQRPYVRGADCAPEETYPAYRRRKFDDFLARVTADLPADLLGEWREQVRLAEAQDLPVYQRQMSILACLQPGPYGETRASIPLPEAYVGVIHGGHYYLLPACREGTDQPADVATVRAQVAALIARPGSMSPVRLAPLARVRRAVWPDLRGKLNRGLLQSLDALCRAPILLNCDPRPRHLPLAELRQAERGVGDHPLTILDTGASFVLDQSHIFFDGAWGAALAEILTNEALSWAVYLRTLPPAEPGLERPAALAFPLPARERAAIESLPSASSEVSAETDVVQLKALLALRRSFKQRSDLLALTVNDLLVLYRAVHAVTYRPDPALVVELEGLVQQSATRTAAAAALEAVDPSRQVNPAILIPVDASPRSPRERLYPMSFEVPLSELDLLSLHERTVGALDAYEGAGGDRGEAYAQFDGLQRTYLGTLAGFGAVMARAKEMALQGESASVGALKLLAHLPAPLQRLLDLIPGRFDLLNDILKGREVFSNVGAVAPDSTLRRFITAKDDNDKKTLAWGILSDAAGVLRITLRDFRPHVGLLSTAGCRDVAVRLAEDYLGSYGRGLNFFVRELQRVTLASRETQPAREEPR